MDFIGVFDIFMLILAIVIGVPVVILSIGFVVRLIYELIRYLLTKNNSNDSRQS